MRPVFCASASGGKSRASETANKATRGFTRHLPVKGCNSLLKRRSVMSSGTGEDPSLAGVAIEEGFVRQKPPTE